MKTRLLGALAALLIPIQAFAAPTYATTGNLSINDSTGTAQKEIVIPLPGYSGSSPTPFYLGHVNFGELSSTGVPTPEAIDSGDGGAWVHSLSADDQTFSGTLALGTLNSAVTIPLNRGRAGVGFNVSGLTAGGGTVVLEAQDVASGLWTLVSMIQSGQAPGAALPQTSVTADGNYTAIAANHVALRLRVSVAAGAAASASVGGVTTTASGIVRETNSAAILAAAQTVATNTGAALTSTQLGAAGLATATAQATMNASLSTIANASVGGLALAAAPTPSSATTGVALPQGARGTEIRLQPSGTATFAIEATATCGASAPASGASFTEANTGSGPLVDDIVLGSGVSVCLLSSSGAFDRGY